MKNKKNYLISLLFTVYFTSATASPLIVAHRAGTADYPENTVHAISMAIKNQADVIWLSIQLTRDGIPVLYRPSDLKSLTNSEGLISEHSLLEIKMLDAAHFFKTEGQYFYRGRGMKIPSLQDVFTRFPKNHFILDIKSPDADPVIMANILSTLITSNNLLDKVTLYSTDRKYLDALPDSINKFENRHVTRKILTNAVMANDCKISAKRDKTQYHAFELRREVKVVEKFTLGKGASRAQLVWNQQAMDCFKKNSNSKILLIGINSAEDYQLAKDLGADYVMTDSPATAKNWR
ncbi:glycerophosphodiester phosphodiesterase [Yersinia pestis]|uniref:Exported protein n=16 Tax=Yersinia pseudotuberculosis complex TaxID=1649845 RepID=A0AAX2I5B2_YERPE|nr:MULTISPECIES: glycerophosphodiester phosphodiesterase family protein [Yersinia pseudotuberculosis complex]EDR31889.1 glycerophosphoryl diester phosphodiesterase family protein [Yersinia pestis biovar Orientalis str. IP275]ERP73895.1 glycerophosphodiester phosphodiesterase [Yersinia pestis 24H]CQD48360.1 glycerophosphoryl diester phosphodiesterase [Yersinia intermedia]AAM85842.1 hypothetical [Yersinia pestis KIM10+]AAS62092.1 putative exported protein [Yersinia pestis biovar Microtus str. 91